MGDRHDKQFLDPNFSAKAVSSRTIARWDAKKKKFFSAEAAVECGTGIQDPVAGVTDVCAEQGSAFTSLGVWQKIGCSSDDSTEKELVGSHESAVGVCLDNLAAAQASDTQDQYSVEGVTDPSAEQSPASTSLGVWQEMECSSDNSTEKEPVESHRSGEGVSDPDNLAAVHDVQASDLQECEDKEDIDVSSDSDDAEEENSDQEEQPSIVDDVEV